MANDLKEYRTEKLIMLEEDFKIHINMDEYTKLLRAKSKIEIDNIVRTIFEKYL